MEFHKESIKEASSIFVVFNASTWDRCHEHGPADELREFILELDDSFNDKKVSLCIDETGPNPCFDLDTFVSRVFTHKPELVFKEVVLRGNF